MELIKLWKDNKHYPRSEWTSKASHILKILPPRPILTPFLVELWETDKYFVEVVTDHDSPATIGSLKGITVITKTGDRVKELEIGGFISIDDIRNHIKLIDKIQLEKNHV